jgi:hypothetical protein
VAHLGCPHPSDHSVLDFGKFLVNFGNTANTSQGNRKIGNILNVFAVFPKFPKNLPKSVHCGRNDGDIPNVPLSIISVTLFWFILNFTDSVHCDHTDGEHCKVHFNEPLGNITGTFFGKIQGFPTHYLIRTLRSHDLVH